MTIETTGRVIDRQIGIGAAGFRVEVWDRPSTLVNQSDVVSGIHQHFITGAVAVLTIDPENSLIAYTSLGLSKVMLQWNDGTWEHRAHWGANNIDRDTDGTESRRFLRGLPAAGERDQLEAPDLRLMPEGNDKSDDWRDGAGIKGGANG